MKKIFLILFLIGTYATTNAQFLNYGIIGGINQNKNGTLRATIDESVEKIKSHKEPGYHFGAFTEINIPFFYLRPELLYTKTESSYKYEGETGDLTIKKIDIPVMLGLKVLGLGRIFAGPTFQYILDTDFDYEHFKNVSSDDFSLGMQIGAGVELGKIGADIRWERGLSDTEAEFIQDYNQKIRIDTRPDQIIFSVYYKFR